MTDKILLIPQEDDNLHKLEVARLGDHISLNTNNRSLGLSLQMVDEIIIALQAVRSGEYDKAITQTSERIARELARKPDPLITLIERLRPSQSERSQSERPAVPKLEDI